MMKNRDSAIRELRPEIPAIQADIISSAAEKFQNETLRPVLKFQHELLLDVFKQYIRKRKGEFYKLTLPHRLTWIDRSVRKDLKFRNFLIGMVVGHFTSQEWQIYASLEQELSRRVVDLIVQRLGGQVENL